MGKLQGEQLKDPSSISKGGTGRAKPANEQAQPRSPFATLVIRA